MKVAKECVKYYCKVTNKPWNEFFNKIDTALNTPYEVIIDREIWLVKKLLDYIVKYTTIEELIQNKDDIKSVFDADARKNAGEFFTPEIWAAEGRKYFDQYIPNWHEYNVWDMSCYTMDTLVFIRRSYTPKSDDSSIVDKVSIVDNSCQYVQGWVHYDDLRDTDMILTRSVKSSRERWTSFYNKFKKKYSGGMTTFVLDGGDISVTDDHLMLIRQHGENKVVEAGTIEYSADLVVYGTEYTTIRVLSIERSIVEDIDVWDLKTMNDDHIFLVRHGGISLFSHNCGSGNLMRTANHPVDKLFLSSLQDDDIEVVKATPAYQGATVFQLDFLQELDYDIYNAEFVNKLPERLQEIIRNDEPLIFYANPPYKSGTAKTTDVGRYMCDIGLNKPAYDLFYQFCWRVMHFVEMFNLSNTYYCFFGPLTFFTGSNANVLYKEFQKCFEFIDGMCIPAQDFSGTSESIDWGIGCSLWKSRGGYHSEIESKGVLLEKKVLDSEGKITSVERTLYNAPRMKLSDWCTPKDVLYMVEAPLATSHLTFKGSEVFCKEAPKTAKIASNALGTLMYDDMVARGYNYSGILTLPSSINHVDITEENFWRCVASFVYRNAVTMDWSDTKRWYSSPDTSIDGYQEWLYMSLPLFLCEMKNMTSSLRGIKWCGDVIDVPNKLFYISQNEVRQHCNDDRILNDMDTHESANQFLLEQIELSKPYWTLEGVDVFNWCKDYILASLNNRASVGYKGSLEAWDAGFQQVRSSIWDDKLNEELFGKLSTLREVVRKDANNFGFLYAEE